MASKALVKRPEVAKYLSKLTPQQKAALDAHNAAEINTAAQGRNTRATAPGTAVVPVGPAIKPLTTVEAARLAELTAIIKAHVDGFFKTALALLELRDKRLYRATHVTFEAFCEEELKITRQHGY